MPRRALALALVLVVLAPLAQAAPPGRTHFPAERFEGHGPARLFELPLAGAAPVVALVDAAEREVLVEGYTLASPEIAAALARAARRGVEVRVLLEGAPVGGVPSDEERAVAALADAGAEVAWMRAQDGHRTRYLTVHAKVLVVDRERALVSTDNWVATSWPAVPSGEGTRGVAVLLEDRALASRLADVVTADLAPWPDLAAADPARLPPPVLAAAHTVEGPSHPLERWNATLVLSPDDPHALLRAMEDATETIDAAQLFATSEPHLDALLDAARRGVRVRLLLDARADASRNAPAVERLLERAHAEGLPLEARLADPERLLHAKLVVLDGRAAYVGSMNWGRAAVERNREAGVLLGSAEGAAWLTQVFGRWWGEEGGGEEAGLRPAAGVALAVGLALALAFRRTRRPRASRRRGARGRGGARTRSR